MKILIVGGGGREHALAWKLSQGRPAREAGRELLCAPGNAGTAALGRNIDVAPTDLPGLTELATREGVDLVVVGPEAPLCAGLADRLAERGIATFGPRAEPARIEGSKAFSKAFFARHGIPSAAYGRFTEAAAAEAYIRERDRPQVVKADGLAAGKGVIVCDTAEEAIQAAREMLTEGRFGDAGAEVVIEDRLVGVEASFMALCDGERLVPLASAQDHKRAYDGDEGPNTGGMGAFSPSPQITPALQARVMDEVMRPLARGLAAEGAPYRGVLYAGLMLGGEAADPERPLWVLEINCRFGDPETQPVLARLDEDLAPLLLATARGELVERPLRWDARAALCVVLASGGYPARYEKGHVVAGLAEAGALDGVTVFHAGTARRGDDIVTAGGRVLGVTALGADLSAARALAYAAVERIHWPDMHHRADIGAPT